MRIKYREIDFGEERSRRIVQMNAILGQYQGRVSVRQLYYRLVAGGIIPNNQKEYDKVQSLVTEARYAGLLDWEAIEDRNREAQKASDWASGAEILEGATASFRLNRWATQPYYVELWVEKAALEGILAPISNDYHMVLMTNRGYSSASAMKESADRIRHHIAANNKPKGQQPVILYAGDHDPSGKDMIRDVRARLVEFGVPPQLDVRAIALTWEQIQKYQPPPNAAKLSDSRAAAYIEQYGSESWELDALPPPDLDLIVRTAVNSYVDKKAMTEIIKKEVEIKKRIKAFAKSLL